MNKILQINKKILLLILILISLLFTIIIIKKNLNDSFNQIISNLENTYNKIEELDLKMGCNLEESSESKQAA